MSGEQLEGSWTERATIYQAAGMVAVRDHDIDSALSLLQRRARADGVDLLEMAQRVVDREVRAADVAAGGS